MMTNQLESHLHAIQYTISHKQMLRKSNDLTPIQRNNLSQQINELQKEERRILNEIGIKEGVNL